MKYEKFWEISKFMRAVTINSEFSLPGLIIINELDRYPIELLSLLPRYLRYLLLSRLPLLDLNRLDSTAVAKGIDTDEIWRSRTRRSHFDNSAHADLFMSRKFKTIWFPGSQKPTVYGYRIPSNVPNLESGIVAATKVKPCKENFFLTLTWNILSDICCLDAYISENVYTETLDGLTSILSQDFITQPSLDDSEDSVKKLPGASPSNSDYDDYKNTIPDSYHQLWQKQAIPLAKFMRYDKMKGHVKYVALVPQPHLPIRECRNDPLKLLNFIIVECGLQPSNLCINTDILYGAYSALREHYPTNEDHRLFLKSILSKIVILALTDISSEKLDILPYILEIVVGDGRSCRLKTLEIRSTIGYPTENRSLTFLSPYLFTMPSNPPSLPHYQGLSVLEVESPLEASYLCPTSLLYLNSNTH